MERLLQERIATLHEIETYYSIDDVADRNEGLDAIHEAQHAAQRAEK